MSIRYNTTISYRSFSFVPVHMMPSMHAAFPAAWSFWKVVIEFWTSVNFIHFFLFCHTRILACVRAQRAEASRGAKGLVNLTGLRVRVQSMTDYYSRIKSSHPCPQYRLHLPPSSVPHSSSLTFSGEDLEHRALTTPVNAKHAHLRPADEA